VEFPLGKLMRVKRHFSKLWNAIDDWPANRDPHTIVHELDEAGTRELHPWRAEYRYCKRTISTFDEFQLRARRKSMEANAV